MAPQGSGPHKVTEAIERSAPAAQGCVLRVTEGPDRGKEVVLTKERVVVGTRQDSGLVLTDSTVSGQHFSVEPSAQGVVVTDLESRNGTFYLETRLAKAILQHGAVLTAGRSKVAIASLHPPASKTYSHRDAYGSLIGASPAMRRLYAAIEQIEAVDYPVLILGETGVGKEVVAREIHAHSARTKGPWEVCDCTALPQNLVESELFGHARGAFTGAQDYYPGAFERAQRGSIFLDEIGELPLEFQPKLLRVLENRVVKPLGATKQVEIDARILTATNRTLADEVRKGTFREDLFFRLSAIKIHVPPLRERREDIPLLVRHFLEGMGRSDALMSPATLELFTTGYDWPGNVRELKNVLAETLTFGAVPEGLGEKKASAAGVVTPGGTFQEERKRVIDAFERDYLKAVLDSSNGNISAAARQANVERTQFKRLLRRHELLGSGED
jgi:transcriptional regulator with GAF, ATPase, and Fis domain